MNSLKLYLQDIVTLGILVYINSEEDLLRVVLLINTKIVLSNLKICYPMQQMWYSTRKTGREKFSFRIKFDLGLIITLKYRDFFALLVLLCPFCLTSLLSCFGRRGIKRDMRSIHYFHVSIINYLNIDIMMRQAQVKKFWELNS